MSTSGSYIPPQTNTGTGTDDQTLTLVDGDLTIEDGNTVDLSDIPVTLTDSAGNVRLVN